MAKKKETTKQLKMTLALPNEDYDDLIAEGERLSLLVEGCKIAMNCAAGACKLTLSCDDKKMPPPLEVETEAEE